MVCDNQLLLNAAEAIKAALGALQHLDFEYPNTLLY